MHRMHVTLLVIW